MGASACIGVVGIAILLSCAYTGAQQTPGQLGNPELAEMGLLDVTAAPFDADPTGRHDSTKALHAAIDYARSHCMVVFFPAGTGR